MTVAEWSTIANLATALGTLILAVATFSAVRSSNLMAKVAQQQLLIQLRPVLSPSRREDPTLKVNFGDMKWVQIPGGCAVGQVGTGDGSMGGSTAVVYLAIGLRNAGNGIAVLQGWRFFPDAHRDTNHAPLEEFQRQTRDLYIPVGDVGFWQGAFRDPSAAGYEEARSAIEGHRPWSVELLYADHEGGQRAISRFLALPVEHQVVPEPGDHQGQAELARPEQARPEQARPEQARPGWLASASRHWSLDREDASQQPFPGARVAQ
jgi:hypothetical protein